LDHFASKRLWHGDQEVKIRSRPLALLRYLVERPQSLVTKKELLKRLWPGIYVTKTVLKVCVREIRQALADDATTPEFIETVGTQGYRFIAPPHDHSASSQSSVLSFQFGVRGPNSSTDN
jgi:DNA-binding winged helix-turn-helix (wHTH) protein